MTIPSIPLLLLYSYLLQYINPKYAANTKESQTDHKQPEKLGQLLRQLLHKYVVSSSSFRNNILDLRVRLSTEVIFLLLLLCCYPPVYVHNLYHIFRNIYLSLLIPSLVNIPSNVHTTPRLTNSDG